jgi:phosphoglucomutase/phosphomannomutase
MAYDGLSLRHAAGDVELSDATLANLMLWLTDPEYSAYVPEIEKEMAAGRWLELRDAFYQSIPFGTGGRRGPRGVGPNRINARTIGESAAGLGQWALARWVAEGRQGQPSAVIARDTRVASDEYSVRAAQILAALGFRVYLFSEPRSTPELSYAVLHMKAATGIMISASHNLPADNGFKAYSSDGGQLVPPFDREVMDAVKAVGEAPLPVYDPVVHGSLIETAPDTVHAGYIAAVTRCSLRPERDITLVYTPLHGVGDTAVLPALSALGYPRVHPVEAQMTHDGEFPNVHKHTPNPEFPGALNWAQALAMELDADLAIATDPDADRVGCAARRMTAGGPVWETLTGNQIGALLCWYVLDSRRELGLLRPDHLVLTTAVTSPLIGTIARDYGVGVIDDLLVGFKYVAAVLNSIDDPTRIAFAAEESHGYLSGAHARDKDGANAAVLLAECAAYLATIDADAGLHGLLRAIYRRYGYHRERLESPMARGKAGADKVLNLMSRLRNRPPAEIAGMRVQRITDRKVGRTIDLHGRPLLAVAPIMDPLTGRALQPLRCANDDLLIFDLAGDGGCLDGATLAVRPSGTEPKCKFYLMGVKRMPEVVDDKQFDALQQEADRAVDTLWDALNELPEVRDFAEEAN